MSPEHSLIFIKLVHTAIWAVMATAILVIPIAAMRARFRIAACLTALVVVECLVLWLNHGRCPLTDIAARFATESNANFDIYLPLWLAEHNKTIFGGLFAAGELVWLWQWRRRVTLIGIGGTVTRPPLPHHRTCGPHPAVRWIELCTSEQTWKSERIKVGDRKCGVHGWAIGYAEWTMRTPRRLCGQGFAHSPLT
jgi:hypothetical protein